MYFVLTTAYLVVAAFWFLLILRIIYDVIPSFARGWRPRGANLILASLVMTVTDPPLRWLRSKIPPLNLGGIGIDVAFLILFVVVMIGRSLIVFGLRSVV